MCVSAFPADFTQTAICMYEVSPTHFGRPTHVMLYQNKAINLNNGPNAMLLHIDSAMPMGPNNFIATTDFPHLLDDMVEALTPVEKSVTRSFSIGIPKGVQIFTVGIYTVVLAQNAADIPAALRFVPEDKRPQVNKELFDFYANTYPGCTVALCCFNKSSKSEPLMFWWEPKDPSTFRAPALDEHTGRVPELGAPVEVDHWLIAGSYRMQGGVMVDYSDVVPEDVRVLLPNYVVGRHVSGTMRNGDFGINVAQVTNGQFPRDVPRLGPPPVWQ